MLEWIPLGPRGVTLAACGYRVVSFTYQEAALKVASTAIPSIALAG